MKVEADLDENAHLLAEYDVTSLPTVVLKVGDKVGGVSVGLRTEAEYRDWIDLFLSVEEVYTDAGADPTL